jgi:hypothetical protein
MKDEIGREMAGQFGLRFRLHVNRRVVLHAAKLRHGIGGFTSPPKEGMLWIFSVQKSEWFGRLRWIIKLAELSTRSAIGVGPTAIMPTLLA